MVKIWDSGVLLKQAGKYPDYPVKQDLKMQISCLYDTVCTGLITISIP